MNKVIQKKNFRYVKLCLISPIFDIIVSIAYIVTFLVLSFEYFSMGNNYTNFEINEMTKDYIDDERFKSIKTDNDFIAYLDLLLKKLYTYDPNVSIPIMIPLGAIKMIKYSNKKEECSDLIKPVNCATFACTTSELGELYKTSQCGRSYIKEQNKKTTNKYDPFEVLVFNFDGVYSKYNLYNGGEQIDITVDEYNLNPNKYNSFIQDPDLKFLALVFSIKIPSNNNYVNVIAGIEMINYFSYSQTFISSAVYSIFDPYNASFLTLFIFFSCSVLLSIIKLLYEISIKLILSVHLFCLFNECLNILIIVFTTLYLYSTNDMDYNSLKKEHSSHITFMSIKKYLVILISITMFCIPFRIISLISWCQLISRPFVKYMGVIFRMLPGILISILVIGSIVYMFSLMNYALYNQYFFQFSTIYDSFLAIFNPQVILEILRYESGIRFSLMSSPYYVVFNLFQLLIVITFMMIFASSFTYLFGLSSSLEEEKMEDEIMIKLRQIEEKLTQGKDVIDTDLKKLKKLVLWLNLSPKSEIYNVYNEGNELLLFKVSNQIISFLKYLFAIKPELQFKNLYNKFRILIEVKNDKPTLKNSELEQIEILVDWLMFVGCKIPVILYSQCNVEKTLKMKLHSKFNHISFTIDQNELANFIKETTNEIVCCQVEKLSFTSGKNINHAKSITTRFQDIFLNKKK